MHIHIHAYVATLHTQLHSYTHTYVRKYACMYICMYILTWDPGLALYLSSAGTHPHKGTGLNLHVTKYFSA